MPDDHRLEKLVVASNDDKELNIPTVPEPEGMGSHTIDGGKDAWMIIVAS